MKKRLPERLKKGDLIGIIAPAAGLKDEKPFINGLQILREMGFEPVYPRELWPGNYFLADTDENRALEFNRMWAEPSVKALIAARGGYGCLRLLPYLDQQLMARTPKLLTGFSDITLLNAYLLKKHNLISLHGPVVASLPNSSRPSIERLAACLAGNWSASIEFSGHEILRDGQGEFARLIGGNLSTLITLIGTDYDLDYSGAILFMEDVNEPPYKLDRMLTQMKLAGKFEQLAGLILGEFSHDEITDTAEKLRYQEYIWQRMLQLAGGCCPIIAGFPLGHGRENLTLPYGAYAKINTSQGRLEFLP
ncbi:MAG: LD-carboxypeptidase [Deltaproteobacteria bacterium]|nr:MAG: LD-carboxypeptidase [Deltaproteobacteria bacterium]